MSSTTDLDAVFELTPLADANDADRAHFLDLLGACFHDESAWTTIVPNDAAARHAAYRFYAEKVRFNGLVASGYLVRERATGRIVGHAALAPPSPPPGPLLSALRAQMVDAVGPTVTSRIEAMRAMFAEMTALVAKKYPEIKGQTWGLHGVFVDPEMHGRGIGTWAMRKLLTKFPSVPVLLFTQEEQNMRWYSKKFGFEVVATYECLVDGISDGPKFTTWTMVSLPKSAKTTVALAE
ncbi:hypothetical protein GGF31_004964 [Allomyces arbusculus]|nr:hypothetical protein GGF31_004964 [Allomyces arbusculus]